MILSLSESGSDSVQARFKRNFIATIVGVTAFYVVFGSLGFAAFGAATRPMITLNLSPASTFSLAPVLVQLCLCFSLYFSYPLMLHPLSGILDARVSSMLPGKAGMFVTRGILVGITACVILVFPNFADLLEIIGSICCTLLAFVLPGTSTHIDDRNLTSKH